MRKLGFVVINYNDWKQTKTLIDNIKDYKCLDKIVIVDNKSSDNSVEMLKKLENEKTVLIEAKENGGYAKGLNIGARYLLEVLEECNIIFSNTDIIIHKEEDLERLNSDIEKHSIGVVGPTIVENRKLNRGWMMPTIKDEILFNLPIIGKRHREELKYDEKHYEEELSIVGVVSGCFFCVDGRVLEQVGFFDEETFLYYEEQILSKKLEQFDKQVAVDNEVVVIHNHSVTIDKNINRINKYKAQKKSQRYFVKKYLEANEKDLKKLNFTYKLSLVILYIRCFFKGGLKK